MSSITSARDQPQVDEKFEVGQIETLPPHPLSPIQATTWQSIVRFRRAFITGLIAACGGLYIGNTDAAIGAIVANKGFIDVFGTVHTAKGLALNAQYVSIWGAIQIASSIVAHASVPFVADRYGRKPAMYILLVSMVVAIVLEIVGKNWKTFLAAKLFVGISAGFLGASYMTYMMEISIPEYRGVLLCSFQLSFKLGSFTNAIACYIVNQATPLAYLRVFYSEFVFVGILLAVSLYLPESPIWLIRKGKTDKARLALRRIFGHPKDWDLEAYLATQIAETEASEELVESQGHNDWKTLFKKPNLLRCIVASLPYTGQQVAGVAYINTYTTYFFQQAGVANPFLGNVILTCIALLATFMSFFFVDRLGRRPLMIWGMGGCVVINFLIGGLGFAKANKSSGSVLTALCSVWELVYGLSIGPLGWSTLVEVASLRLAAKTATFGLLANDLLGLVWKYCVPILLSAQQAGWGQKIGLFFGGLAILWWIPLYFLFPETKGRTFTEIDELYERGVSPRHFAKTVLTPREDLQAKTAVADAATTAQL